MRGQVGTACSEQGAFPAWGGNWRCSGDGPGWGANRQRTLGTASQPNVAMPCHGKRMEGTVHSTETPALFLLAASLYGACAHALRRRRGMHAHTLLCLLSLQASAWQSLSGIIINNPKNNFGGVSQQHSVIMATTGPTPQRAYWCTHTHACDVMILTRRTPCGTRPALRLYRSQRWLHQLIMTKLRPMKKTACLRVHARARRGCCNCAHMNQREHTRGVQHTTFRRGVHSLAGQTW